jgi:hypothetical protein
MGCIVLNGGVCLKGYECSYMGKIGRRKSVDITYLDSRE